jgi:hypothetical protein
MAALAQEPLHLPMPRQLRRLEPMLVVSTQLSLLRRVRVAELTCDIPAATGTSSASASATSKAAADTMRVGVSLAGIVGVFAVVFAL